MEASIKPLIHLAMSLSIHQQTYISLEAFPGTQIYLDNTAASSHTTTALTAASKHPPVKTIVQVRVSIAAIKHHDQKQVGKERVCLACAATCWNMEAGAHVQAMEERCLLAYIDYFLSR